MTIMHDFKLKIALNINQLSYQTDPMRYNLMAFQGAKIVKKTQNDNFKC